MDRSPLISGSDRLFFSGKYHVEMHIPSYSTLTRNDAELIGNLASWNKNPNEMGSDSFDGGRAIRVEKEKKSYRGGIELYAAQISGIGFIPIQFNSNGTSFTEESDMVEPDKENFMKIMKSKTAMGTSYVDNGSLKIDVPQYRARGTYTAPELKEKVIKTEKISKMEFETFAIPIVEAYGWYLDERLYNNDGNFGFFVYSVPSVSGKRVAEKTLDVFSKSAYTGMRMEDAMRIFFECFRKANIPIAKSMRELHDKGRIAHRQFHLSNIFIPISKPYIVDWPSYIELDGSREYNVLNRVIDVKRPSEDFMKMFDIAFSNTEFFQRGCNEILMMNLVLSEYLGKNVDVLSAVSESQNNQGEKAEDYHVIETLLKNEGIEN